MSGVLDQWRDGAARGKSYDALSSTVGDAIKLPLLLSNISVEALIDVVTFQDAEKRIASELRDRIVHEGFHLIDISDKDFVM